MRNTSQSGQIEAGPLQNSENRHDLQLAFAASITVLTGGLLYQLVEKPAIRAGRRLNERLGH